MATYKCGYCGTFNKGDIWCSDEHRLLWYEERRVPKLTGMLTSKDRRGPQRRQLGAKRLGRPKSVKKV